MLERRENLPLLEEAAHGTVVLRAPPTQQLEGDRLVVLLVGALGEIDRAHAAMPELADDAIHADARARRALVGLRGEIMQERRREFRGGRVEHRRSVGVRQQTGHFGTERGIAAAGAPHEQLSPLGGQVERLVENVEDLPPPRGGTGSRGDEHLGPPTRS